MNDLGSSVSREEIVAFMHAFYEAYYSQRDVEKICSMVAENIVFIGLSSNEICHDKKTFEACIRGQMGDVPNAITYFASDEVQRRCGENLWICTSTIGLRVTSGNWGIVRYVLRLMATIQSTESGMQIVALYISEASMENAMRNVVFSSNPQNPPVQEPVTRNQVRQIINYLIPGGVVSRKTTEGYPISAANYQYLKMCGYAAYEEYAEAQNHCFLNSIHPDDVEKYIYTAQFIAQTGKQYECEYRIRRKDQTYLWVHDVGRKASSVDGQEIIVSVITDMSDQIERRHRLEEENGIDFLTQVYNRNGATARMEEIAPQMETCIFLIADLDNFKQVNDLYGHLIGDEVLKYIASLLKSTFQNGGIVCRLGGDEFTVLIPNYSSVENVTYMLRELARTYKAYTEHVCPQAGTSLSIGGIYGTISAASRRAKLKSKYQQADKNLYHVKNHEKGGILFTQYDD